MVAVPVDEARYYSLAAVKGGLVWLRYPVAGLLGDGVADLEESRPKPVLERFDLRKREASVLTSEVSWFAVSGDGARLVIGDEHKVRVVPSDRKVDNGSSDDAITVDLSRARFSADPAALWAHAYAEFGRLLRRDFWTPTMSDVDWDGVLDDYRFLLGRIRSSAEFGDLLWEVAAELGTSHAYVMPSSTFTARSTLRGAPAALLGADVARSADGRWLVERVLPGESSDPHARSPFGAPGVAVREGDEILAVDGRPVDPVYGPWPALAGTHGKPVELTIRPADPSLVPWPPAADPDDDEADDDAADARARRQARRRAAPATSDSGPSAAPDASATPDSSATSDSSAIRHFGLLHHLRLPSRPGLLGHGHGRILGRLRPPPRRKRRRPASLAETAGTDESAESAAPVYPETRRVVIVPLYDDRRLRYQDWVAGRRQFVRARSDGRVGYLHVPDMMGEGWAHLHRDLRTEMGREALIIDVRGNRGGHTSQLIVEKLARRITGWKVPRRLRPYSYPHDAPRGPLVALTDEFAGSDGDIVTAAIRSLGLGPVIGARTWGGVVGIDGHGHELVDGTHITVPRYATWFNDFGWSVENYGVDPDTEVLITPDDWAVGRDPQLEVGGRPRPGDAGGEPARPAPRPGHRPGQAPPAPPAPPVTPTPGVGHHARHAHR